MLPKLYSKMKTKHTTFRNISKIQYKDVLFDNFSSILKHLQDTVSKRFYWEHFIMIVKVKWKTKKYHTVRTILKSNIKIVERGDTPNTQIYDRSLSCLNTCTSMKSG
jgi:hypothetical protein